MMKQETLFLCLLVMISIAGSQLHAAIDEGLIGYWPLNGDALDYSDNDNSGTLLNGASFVDNTTGTGQVLQTQLGAADAGHVQVALPASFHPGGDVVNFTTSGALWVMFDDRESIQSANGWQTVIKHAPGVYYVSRNLGQNRLWTMVRSEENGHVDSGNYWPKSTDGSVPYEGRWTHIAWTFHSHNQGSEGHFRWYIDGILSAEYTSGVQTINTSDFRIGGSLGNDSPNTKIAEVRLYDRILTPEEVAELAGLDQFNPVPKYPAWWGIPSETSLEAEYVNGIPEEDYSPVLLGQLKYMANKARIELDTLLAPIGGAGDGIDTFTAASTDNAPANIGQLKYVSSQFFDRLAEVGFVPGSAGWPVDMILDKGSLDYARLYPWMDNVSSGANSPALLGQLKYLFSWDIEPWIENASPGGSDGDGLPDWWEEYWFGDLITADSSTDYDGDGLNDADEYDAEMNPIDFYNDNAQHYQISIINSSTPTASRGQLAQQPLVLEIRDSNGALVPNAPIYLRPDAATALLATDSSGTNLSTALVIRTDANGTATIYIQP